MKIAIDEEVLTNIMTVLGKCSEKIKSYESMGLPDDDDDSWGLPLDTKKTLERSIERYKTEERGNGLNDKENITNAINNQLYLKEKELLQENRERLCEMLNDTNFSQKAQSFIPYLCSLNVLKTFGGTTRSDGVVIVVPNEHFSTIMYSIMKTTFEILCSTGKKKLSIYNMLEKSIKAKIHQCAVADVSEEVKKIAENL